MFMFCVFSITALLAAEPEVLWSAVNSGGVYCSIEMDDLDGDSIPDVACGVNFWDGEPTLWAVSGADGGTIWTSSSHKGIYSNEGFMWFPDVDGDDMRDILMATPGGYEPPGRCLYLISGADGSTIWEWAACEIMPSYTGWGYSACVVDDMTGDGIPEAVGGFGTSGSSGTGLVACIDGSSGDSLWTRWMPDATEDLHSYIDADEDGFMDILVATGGNSYTANTASLISGADGSLLWQKDPGGDCMSLGLVEQPDTWPMAVFCTFNGKVACYDGGGTLQWDYDGSGMYMDVRGGSDVNSDGVGDVALAADNAGVICFSGADGSILWSYPSGSNTWSVTWVDPVIIEGIPVPCVAAGSVNGRAVTLINALTGEAVWEMPFTERVYNVSAVSMGLASPVVIAGLQDQESLPTHAWALASSTESGVPDEAEQAGVLRGVNPSSGSIRFTVTGANDAEVECFDLSGRMVFRGTYPGGGETHSSEALSPGVYLLRVSSGNSRETHRLTVI